MPWLLLREGSPMKSHVPVPRARRRPARPRAMLNYPAMRVTASSGIMETHAEASSPSRSASHRDLLFFSHAM
jgi:hypothetical protein